MKQEEKKLNDTEQKSERKRFQEENVRRKEEAKVKEVKAKDKVTHTHTRNMLRFFYDTHVATNERRN